MRIRRAGAGYIFGDRATGDGHGVGMQQGQYLFHHCGHTASRVKIRYVLRSRRIHLGDMGRAARELLEHVHGDLTAFGFVGDGRYVQGQIG